MNNSFPGSKEMQAAARNGFALIEVLVAIGLSAVVLLGTAEMLIRAVQMRGAAENRLLLVGTACSELERLKGADPAGSELAAGTHGSSVDAGAKGPIALTWVVEEAGPGTILVRCTAAFAGGGSGRRTAEASMLISKRLGF